MTSAIVLLLVVAALVTLSIVRPARLPDLDLPTVEKDRDRARQLAELRALPDSRAELPPI
ncbi:hypothetical protein [Pseudonocardia kunmingensis]|uniref:Uncharacterized protein n=1 Tax=Pseudonocardia kunmingensis TaxID=630975 RepID=A0A543DXV0_9PSEU|nr:hypothetical protein [Pseudonocardia kunmingensis]TQM14153.1 hypothetical protein FB558_0911 [Pseudonocardia kunmingensis]